MLIYPFNVNLAIVKDLVYLFNIRKYFSVKADTQLLAVIMYGVDLKLNFRGCFLIKIEDNTQAVIPTWLNSC